MSLHTHRDTHIWTPANTPMNTHKQAQLGTHAHTHPGARSTQHAAPEPASPAKREMPAPREATMGGTGWQPLIQPQGASRDIIKSKGKVWASWG